VGWHLDNLRGQVTDCLDKAFDGGIRTGGLDTGDVTSSSLRGVACKIRHCQASLLKWRQWAPTSVGKGQILIDEFSQPDDAFFAEPVLLSARGISFFKLLNQ